MAPGDRDFKITATSPSTDLTRGRWEDRIAQRLFCGSGCHRTGKLEVASRALGFPSRPITVGLLVHDGRMKSSNEAKMCKMESWYLDTIYYYNDRRRYATPATMKRKRRSFHSSTPSSRIVNAVINPCPFSD